MKVSVKVKPNSRGEEVISNGKGLLVKVKEPPKEGKANRAIIRLLAEYYKVTQSSVRIISGIGNKSKVVEVDGE